jgi:hypothetical protein
MFDSGYALTPSEVVSWAGLPDGTPGSAVSSFSSIWSIPMMKPTSRLATVICLAGAFSAAAWPVYAAQPTAAENQQLAETIERHFAGIVDFRKGHLICRSQVEELQQYLRRTRGHIPASHRRLLIRILADNAPLTTLYHGEHGEKVLTAAADQLGGYEELASLSRLAAGRTLIREAIQADQPDVLVDHVNRETAARDSQPGKQANNPGIVRIYTVKQLIEAALAPPDSVETPVSG